MTDAQLKALTTADEQARRDALDVTRSFIVQAPAGSGKTELLIQRYLRLLATVEEPEAVLAITFTVKAAAEMRVRVLEALQMGSGEAPADDDYRRVTYDAAQAVLKQSETFGWDLIHNARRLRIQTMDALNASIARAQPITARGAAVNRLLAEAETRQVYRQAAAATLDYLPDNGAEGRSVRRVLEHVDNNTYTFIENLADLLARRDQWLPFVASGLLNVEASQKLRSQFEQTLQLAIGAQLEAANHYLSAEDKSELVRLADYAGQNLLDAGNAAHPIAALAGLETFPAATFENVGVWRSLTHLLLTASSPFGWRKTVNVKSGFPATDKARKADFTDLVTRLRAQVGLNEALIDVRHLPDAAYNDEQWRALVALMRLLPLAAVELRRLFAQQGTTDYTEVAMNAADALGEADNPGKVALLLDVQLQHVLVDEMQDTSSAQYRMLETLTGGWEAGDGRTLFCVGDPMQSIYRFRNAEVGQFLLAKTTGIGSVNLEPLTLRRNFRSGEGLVNWFNTTFANVLPASDNATLSAVSYAPATPVDTQIGTGETHWYPIIGSSRDIEAQTTAQVIQGLLATPDESIAVLVRSRTQLPELLAHLQRHDIAFRAVDIHRLTDRSEIIDILALTRALLHRGDRLAWLAVLRAPWAGLDWTDLHALVTGAPNATVYALLNDPDRMASLSAQGQSAAHRVLQSLDTALDKAATQSLRERVERCWYALGGPALMTDNNALENVNRYLDVLASVQLGDGMEDVGRLEHILDREYVSEPGSARVQVMTMHKAKGLQFDHVVLPSLGRASGRVDSAMLNWLDVPTGRGAEDKLLSVIGATADTERDPVHRFLQRFDRNKAMNELGRLLYVACTRAKQSLHLIGHASLDRRGEALRSPTKGTLLHLLWPQVRDAFDSVFATDGEFAAEEAESEWLMPVRRLLDPPWTPPIFKAPKSANDDSAAQPDVMSSFDWVGAEARVAGVVVHRWLQMAVERDIDLKSIDAEHPVTRRWLSEAGLGSEELETATQRVTAALQGIANDEKGQWLLTGDGEAELALTGVVNERVQNVVLDRVRIDEQGQHWIVDYKTSTHEGGNLQGFIDAEVTRYREQLTTYATIYRQYSGEMPRCALYFPLLQEFVEVSL